MLKASKKDKFSTWTQKIYSPPTDSQDHKHPDQKDHPEALEEHLEEEEEHLEEEAASEEDLEEEEVEIVAEAHSTELQDNSNVDIHMSYW